MFFPVTTIVSDLEGLKTGIRHDSDSLKSTISLIGYDWRVLRRVHLPEEMLLILQWDPEETTAGFWESGWRGGVVVISYTSHLYDPRLIPGLCTWAEIC